MWFIKARRPGTWRRWVDAESAVWRRVKLPAAIIDGGKRIERSRGFAVLNGITCLLYILVTLLNAGAYLQFRHHFRDSRASEASLRAPAVKAALQARTGL